MTQQGFRWAIFGTGAIAWKFAAGLKTLGDAHVAAVASRDADRAAALTRTFGGRAVAGYDPAALAGEVDAIYIATPPALHRSHALAAIAAGIPVLVEKPLGATADDARAIATAAREAGVFCMEAMWTAFTPAVMRLHELVRSGAIGEPRLVSGDFGISNAVDPGYGNFDPARGGGALAHLGYYPVALAQQIFGAPRDVLATGRIGSTGVEEDVALSLRYADGVVGAFHASLRAPTSGTFSISGTHGRLTLQGPIFRPWGVAIERATPRSAPRAGQGLTRERGLAQRLNQWRDAVLPGRGTRTERHFYDGNAYHYEAAEVARRIAAGQVESDIVTLDDSIAIADALDRARGQIATAPKGE